MSCVGNTSYQNKLAVFIRDCRDIALIGNNFSDNYQQGMFISGYGTLPNDFGCKNLTITGNDISFNQSQGVYLQSVTNSVVSGNTINGNFGTGLVLANDNGNSYQTGSVSYCNISNNTINDNGGYGVDVSGNYLSQGCYISSNTILNNFSGKFNYGSSINFNLPGNNGINGYILQTDGSGNTSWTGTFSFTGPTGPTGKIGPTGPGNSPNVVQGTSSSVTTIISQTTPQNTSLAASITPSSSSNKVKITVTGVLGVTVSTNTGYATIKRGSTDLSSSSGLVSLSASPSTNISTPCSMTYLDSPSTTSSTTYTVAIFLASAANSVIWNPNSNLCSIILEEIF